jgi:hypothetical protein
MRSRDKIEVVVAPVGDKLWVKVKSHGKTILIPSFEDIFRMLLAITFCEERKYRGKVQDPAAFVRKFLSRSMDGIDAILADPAIYDIVWAALADEFKIPLRDGH